MNQKKVLNIVKLAVNDRVGKQSHIRNQGIVFYEDGTVNIVEYDDAVQLAKQQNIRIQQLPGDVVSENYQQFRTIANYRPYGKKKESTATKPETSSEKATKKNAKTVAPKTVKREVLSTDLTQGMSIKAEDGGKPQTRSEETR